MKIVGLGISKTGTTTLGSAFEVLGYKHLSFSHKGIKMWEKRSYSSLLKLMAPFDSFDDFPWPLFYKEIDQFFPDTKFIDATTR